MFSNTKVSTKVGQKCLHLGLTAAAAVGSFTAFSAIAPTEAQAYRYETFFYECFSSGGNCLDTIVITPTVRASDNN